MFIYRRRSSRSPIESNVGMTSTSSDVSNSTLARSSSTLRLVFAAISPMQICKFQKFGPGHNTITDPSYTPQPGKVRPDWLSHIFHSPHRIAAILNVTFGNDDIQLRTENNNGEQISTDYNPHSNILQCILILDFRILCLLCMHC